MVVLSVLSNIVNSLSPFTINSIEICESEDFLQLLHGVSVLSDEERKQQVNRNSKHNLLHYIYKYIHVLLHYR